MFDSILQDVRKEFGYGNMVSRLIIINCMVWVAFFLFKLILLLTHSWNLPELFSDILHFFCISADWERNLYRPWTLLTPMFLHEDIWHLVWNMLYLFWFGRIVGDLLGNQRVLPIYLLGGLVGNLTFFAAAQILPMGEFALGASAAVMALLAAAAFAAPDFIIHLFIIGPVRLKYIALFMFLLDLVAISNNSNTGGHFAHLGGAVLGGLVVTQLRSTGSDWTVPVNRMLDWFIKIWREITGSFSSSHRRKPKVVFRNPNPRPAKGHRVVDRDDWSDQQKTDAILDKIKESGYDSLSLEEKEFLFQMSKK